MCVRLNGPATSGVASGGSPAPTRNTELKRFARKSQLISAASRTSGWRRLIIASRDERNKSSWRSSRGWLIVSPNSESRRRRNHEPSKSGIPKRKKIDRRPSLSCKNDYLLRSNHAEQSIASEFFTGDYLGRSFGLLRWPLSAERRGALWRPWRAMSAHRSKADLTLRRPHFRV